MRPLTKKTIIKNQIDQTIATPHIINQMIDSMGSYCAMCEKHIASFESLHHKVLGKLDQNILVTDIDNLLLTCNDCNVHRIQDSMNTQSAMNMLWPDIDNSFSINSSSPVKYVKRQIRYIVEDNGKTVSDQNKEVVLIEANEQPDDELKHKTQNTIDYFKLNTSHYIAEENTIKVPIEHELAMADHRLIERNKAWSAADNASERLKAVRSITDLPVVMASFHQEITRTAQAKGNWSIWMTVFSQHFPDEKDLLEKLFIKDSVEHFNGTRCEQIT